MPAPIGDCIDECIEVALTEIWNSEGPVGDWAWSYLPKETGDNPDEWQKQYSAALKKIKES